MDLGFEEWVDFQAGNQNQNENQNKPKHCTYNNKEDSVVLLREHGVWIENHQAGEWWNTSYSLKRKWELDHKDSWTHCKVIGVSLFLNITIKAV